MKDAARAVRVTRRQLVRGSAAALLLAAGRLAPARAATPSAGEAKLSGTMTLYNGQHESTTDPLVKAFEAKTGVKVRVRSAESDEFASQILEEGSRSPADVFYSEESAPMNLLAEKRMLGPVAAGTLKQIPEQYSDAQGRWVGVSARARVLVYNTGMVAASALPQSIYDLTEAAWKDKVGFVPTSGGFREQLAAIIVLAGEDRAKSWLEGLKRNGKIYRANGDLLDAVDRGQIATGLINHYYWFQEAAEIGAAKMRSQLHYFGHHDPGALLNVSPAGMLKSSKHPDLAQAFLAFLVSEEGQQVLAKVSTEYPLRPGVTSNAPLKPLAELEPPAISVGELGDGQNALELEQEVDLL